MGKTSAAQQAPATPQPASPPFRLVKSQTLNLPKDEVVAFATTHYTLPKSPTEREEEPRRLKELLSRIKAGLFLPCCWATVSYNGITYRMNGMHSSKTIIDGAEWLPATVSIHIDHYEAEAPEAMGLLFRQFDARWSSRSKDDVAGAYQGLAEPLRGLTRGKVKLGIDGVCWYERVVEGSPVPSGDDRYSYILDEKYHPFLRWLEKIITLKTPELKRDPIVAAAYGTFLASERSTQEFWSHVAKNDLTDEADPRSVLAEELLRQKEKCELKPAEFYAKCVKAWNAFRAGEKVKSLNVNPAKGFPSIAA